MTFEIIGKTVDRRTSANVLYCKCSINEYLDLVGDNFEGYSIQRKRENHKAYQRLKNDLIDGALLPSITLALKPDLVAGAKALINTSNTSSLAEYINKRGQADILDGLQRTYLIKDLKDEGIKFPDDQEVLIEYWLEDDISKLIYRMIVLNAGQKVMSMRHQIELLFMSLKGLISEEIRDIEIFLEKEGARRTSPTKYSLSILASAYQAFLTRNTELDKNDLVSDALVKDTVLDASEEEHTSKFHDFIYYFKKVKVFDQLAWHYDGSEANDDRLEALLANRGIPPQIN
jgi:hypothetical protein